MVEGWRCSPRKASSVKRSRMDDLPVPESPMSSSLMATGSAGPGARMPSMDKVYSRD